MFRKKLFAGLLLLVCGQLSSAAETRPVMVPTPRAAVASKAGGQPFLAAVRSQQPLDLALRSYAEKELLVRGYANVYEWVAAGSSSPVVVLADNQPYVSRILVRRPLDAGKFSGRVIVELLNAAAQYESAPLWGFSWEYFLRRGDAWVGVTVSPVAAATLRKFSNTRYTTLNLDARTAATCEKPRLAASALAWDVIAQVGALLRSSSKENPLLDLNPRRLVAAGYGEGGESITTFALALHGQLRLGDGAPIFDGYLNVSGVGVAAISPCAAVPGDADARLAALPRDVPFVSVVREPDMSPLLRGFRDVQSEAVRVYEVAGADAAGPLAAGAPAIADLATAGFVVQAGASCREPLMDVMLTQALNAVWQQLDDQIVQKLPMVSVPSIEPVQTGGTAGGWRLPQLDLPLAGRVTGRPASAQPGNANVRVACDAATGSMSRLDAARLKQLYRTRPEYLRRFNAAVDEAVTGRLLVKEDAAALKAAAVRNTPVF